MKKFLPAALCAGLLAALLSVPALAAPAAPEMQGDFYVLVNGQYVTFTDAMPQIQDGRSCLPFAAVFQQLGFAQEDMTWDGETRTVTAAKGELVISLTIGSNEITVTRSGKSETYTSDVAPYVSAEGRTYIPFGVVAGILGYNVGWDAQNKAVIIDDVDAILAANTATYELMDQYLAYSKSISQGSVKAEGKLAASTAFEIGDTTRPGADHMTVDLGWEGEYWMLMSDNNNFEFCLTMDAEGGKGNGGSLFEELYNAFPDFIAVDMIGDLKSGTFYTRFPFTTIEQGEEIPEKFDFPWYKLDMKAMFDQMSDVTGMDYEQLIGLSMASLDQSFADSLAMILKEMPLTTVEFTATDYLAMFNALCADSSFTKSGNEYVNEFVSMDGVSGTFILTTAAGKVDGYSLGFAMAEPTTGLEMAFATAMKGKEMTAEFGIGADQLPVDESNSLSLSILFSMDGTYSATTEQPDTAPPAGATVVDLMEMMRAELDLENTPAA